MARDGKEEVAGIHTGLESRIIRDLDSVLLYLVKVTGSSGWIRTVWNQSIMENGLSLHIVLPDSALDSFTTFKVHRSQMFQNTTKYISAQCAPD